RAKRGEVFVDVGERIVVPARVARLAIADDGHAAVHDLEFLARWKPDDRVTAEALAADHRFEEVAPRTVGKLEVDGKRRVEIGERLEMQRDSVEAGGCELPEFGFSHGSPRGFTSEWESNASALAPALPSPIEVHSA